VRGLGVVGVARGSKKRIDAQTRTDTVPWEALYDAHASDIARYLRRLVGNADTAADLMQETFARAMRAGRTPALAEMRPWLFRIASNVAMSELRKPRWGDLLGLHRQVRSETSFEEAEQVRHAMRSIPADQAVTLALAFHEGFSRREIAEMLGISEETVKSRIARGRLNFAAAYKRLERGLRA
jgi:RNA polymerase sigma factor (sigma-70 family)